jgi:hypothetical protein
MLIRIEQFIKARRMPPTRFGRDALGDPNLVFQLRDGRELKPNTAARLKAFLDRAEAERRS